MYVPILRKIHRNKMKRMFSESSDELLFRQNIRSKMNPEAAEKWLDLWLSLIIPLPSNQSLIQESDSYFSWGKWESQWCAAQAVRHPARKREKKAHGHDRTTCSSRPKTNKLSFIHIRKMPAPLLSVDAAGEWNAEKVFFLEWKGIRGMFHPRTMSRPFQDDGAQKFIRWLKYLLRTVMDGSLSRWTKRKKGLSQTINSLM